MTLPITPATAPAWPYTQNSPANGDPLDATQLRNDIETPFLDGIYGAQLNAYGRTWRRAVRAFAPGSPDLLVSPMGSIQVTSGGIWYTIRHLTATQFDVTAKGAILAANTRFYVYAYKSGGSLDFAVSTTAPDAALMYEGGANGTDYAFIGTFICNAAATIMQYTQEDNVYRYTDRGATGGGAVDNLILDGTNAAVATAVAYGTSLPVPPAVRAQRVLIEVRLQSATTGYSTIKTSLGPVTLGEIGVTAGSRGGGYVELPFINGSTMFHVESVVGIAPYAWVAGFTY